MTRRTSLTPYAASMRDPDPAMALKAARDAYNASEGEIILIKRSWLTGWADKVTLEQLAAKAGVKGKK